MKFVGTCQFKEWECNIIQRHYNNGRVALELLDTNDGFPTARATVNLPDVPLGEDEVIIKSYSENEGMKEALMNAGIIGNVISEVPAGYVNVTIHKYLV